MVGDIASFLDGAFEGSYSVDFTCLDGTPARPNPFRKVSIVEVVDTL